MSFDNYFATLFIVIGNYIKYFLHLRPSINEVILQFMKIFLDDFKSFLFYFCPIDESELRLHLPDVKYRITTSIHVKYT